MTSLVWGIKASLLTYVRGMPDGRIELAEGATEESGTFVFPQGPGGPLSFRGVVTLVAHGGMMRVILRDPALERCDGTWMLSIADPNDTAVRLPFATIADLVDAGGRRSATGTALSADGADLFFGPYREGTALDDPFVAG